MKKKRKKSSRIRGSHTRGRGGMKKARGSGHRGGFGKAGTGKRADHKKSRITNMKERYFGGSGLKPKAKLDVINVGELESFAKGNKELDLRKYKILGEGDIKVSLKIKAGGASASAIEKVKKAGGEIVIKVEKVVEKKEMKEEASKN